MRRTLLSAFLGLFALVPASEAAPDGEVSPGVGLLDPIKYRQLTVIPVVQQASRPDGVDYLTLAAGLERKEVDVQEAQGGGDVNHVTVHNRSARPLLLLGGEVILGGQQDRIIGKDLIVPPKQTVAVEVYCVEHGRWSGSSAFTSTGGLAEGKIRVRAKYRSDQSQVWDEVATKNQSLNAQSASGTYRKLAAGDEGKKATAPYREHILPALKALPQADKVVGVVAAINGRIVSADIFATPKLFAQYRDRLLDSLFISAADVPESSAPAAALRPADVRSFMDKADGAPAKTVEGTTSGVTVEHSGKGVVNSVVAMPPSAAAPAIPIYRSYQADE
jgi:hypothetical protein